MNIALIGYGKMGKEIEQQALGLGHVVSHIVDIDDSLETMDLSGADVAIEFTIPDAALQNIKLLADKGVNTVVGTTGWYEQMDVVRSIVERSGIGLLWSANFSIGVNAFWKVVEQAGQIMNQLPEYDVFGHEFHHNQKKDSPSGTALQTAKRVLSTVDRKTDLVTEELQRAPEAHELHFSSTRGGSIPGTHSVYFDSPADTIELKHTARNRSGFALGAVKTAEWLKGRKGLFTMDDYINDLFANKLKS